VNGLEKREENGTEKKLESFNGKILKRVKRQSTETMLTSKVFLL
jgi:hypothetical protein